METRLSPASCSGRRASALLALGLVALVSACSPGSSAHTGAAEPASQIAQPRIGPLAASPPAQVTLPLDAYLESDRDGNTIAKAQNLLVATCMKQKGFTYQPQPSSGGTEGVTGIDDPAYGLSSSVGVQTYGYHNDATQLASNLLPYSIHDQYPNGYLVALYGTADLRSSSSHPPGCVDDATKSLAQGQGQYDQNIVGEVGGDAASRTAADSRIVAAIGAWSRCMRSKGFAFATPAQPAKQFAASITAPSGGSAASVPPASAQEVATAEADLACKASVKLAQLWTAVEAGYQSEYIEKNQTALAAYRDAMATKVRRAAQVLSGPTGS